MTDNIEFIQIYLIFIELILISVVLYVAGIPRGIVSLYYVGVGIVCLIYGAIVSWLLEYNFIDVLFLKHATVSMLVPLAIGYPAILVGIVGAILTVFNVLIKK